MDQSRLDEKVRTAALSGRPSVPWPTGAPPAKLTRFQPPRLASLAEQAAARSAPGAAQLEEARLEGRREAEAELAAEIEAYRRATEQVQRSASAFANALDQIEHVDLGTLDDLQKQVLALALHLAEEIVGAELRACDDLVLAAVTRALSLTPDRGTVVLRVHPDDLAVVLESVEAMGHRAGDVQIVADHGVSIGGCTATCGPLQVDAQLPAAFERVRAVFES